MTRSACVDWTLAIPSRPPAHAITSKPRPRGEPPHHFENARLVVDDYENRLLTRHAISFLITICTALRIDAPERHRSRRAITAPPPSTLSRIPVPGPRHARICDVSGAIDVRIRRTRSRPGLRSAIRRDRPRRSTDPRSRTATTAAPDVGGFVGRRRRQRTVSPAAQRRRDELALGLLGMRDQHVAVRS